MCVSSLASSVAVSVTPRTQMLKAINPMHGRVPIRLLEEDIDSTIEKVELDDEERAEKIEKYIEGRMADKQYSKKESDMCHKMIRHMALFKEIPLANKKNLPAAVTANSFLSGKMLFTSGDAFETGIHLISEHAMAGRDKDTVIVSMEALISAHLMDVHALTFKPTTRLNAEVQGMMGVDHEMLEELNSHHYVR